MNNVTCVNNFKSQAVFEPQDRFIMFALSNLLLLQAWSSKRVTKVY